MRIASSFDHRTFRIGYWTCITFGEHSGIFAGGEIRSGIFASGAFGFRITLLVDEVSASHI
jgi:hypothetical protein